MTQQQQPQKRHSDGRSRAPSETPPTAVCDHECDGCRCQCSCPRCCCGRRNGARRRGSQQQAGAVLQQQQSHSSSQPDRRQRHSNGFGAAAAVADLAAAAAGNERGARNARKTQRSDGGSTSKTAPAQSHRRMRGEKSVDERQQRLQWDEPKQHSAQSRSGSRSHRQEQSQKSQQQELAASNSFRVAAAQQRRQLSAALSVRNSRRSSSVPAPVDNLQATRASHNLSSKQQQHNHRHSQTSGGTAHTNKTIDETISLARSFKPQTITRPLSTSTNKQSNQQPPANQKHTTKTMVDQSVIDKLEAGFAKLQAATPEQCHSLLKKHLTREVLEKLKNKQTAMGATLLDVCQSGFENLDSGVGIYAPDAESYTLFADLFNPIIEEYHAGFKPTDKHPASDFGDIESLVNVDPNNEFVISTRVRCGRSLQGYPFNPCLTEAQYKEMQDKVSSTLKEVSGDLAGTYYPLAGMSKDVQQKLIDDHFLFKEGDRFLQAANSNRFWPTGRGIFHNEAKTFLVWVNEEDHLRIISMQQGGDLKTIFGRMVRGVRSIESRVPFSHDDRLGFLTFCPTNLGTTIRASVHIKLPKLAADRKKLEEVAGKFNLQVRGTSGEHTESVGGVYDISNKRRLGLTEYQAVREMQDGILELIKIEKSL